MRPLLAALLVLLPLVLAGCTGGDGAGTFRLHVTDEPDDIGDFAHLNVTVAQIVLHAKGEDDPNSTRGQVATSPRNGTFDLTRLTNGNVTTIFEGNVPAGAYGKLTLVLLGGARGVLLNGTEVDVKAPSNRLFLNADFTIAEGEETDFLFDVQVHRTGNGEYQLKPNATGSGPGKKGSAPPTVEGDAAKADGKGKP